MKKAPEKLILERLEEFAEALEQGEGISERFTCRKIELDLQPTRYTPALVKKTREMLGASQPIFALYLGVSVKTVRAWEQGANAPSDIACRFLDEIRSNPGHVLRRLRDAVRKKEKDSTGIRQA
jgi:putative transcriptional regulator